MRALWLVPLVGCVTHSIESVPPDDMPEMSGWQSAATLHADEPLLDRVTAGMQHGHSLWLAGSNGNRVPITISARAETNVRIAVLGPGGDDARPLLAADGFVERKPTASVTLEVATPGEYLVIAGSYGLASETGYELTVTCAGPGCGPSRIDALATPKPGALVGDPQGNVAMMLGDMLVGLDVDVELWVSPPMQWWNGERIGDAIATGTQLDATLPAHVQPGDDLLLVVRDNTGRVIDTGVPTRYAPHPNPFVRLDRILYYSDGLRIAGVAGFYEGIADLRLYSETRQLDIARDVVRATKPGQPGNGLGAFDANFAPEFAAQAGELLSIGFITGNGEYRRLGCFELAGPSRDCP